jgi:hypothetical protein
LPSCAYDQVLQRFSRKQEKPKNFKDGDGPATVNFESTIEDATILNKLDSVIEAASILKEFDSIMEAASILKELEPVVGAASILNTLKRRHDGGSILLEKRNGRYFNSVGNENYCSDVTMEQDSHVKARLECRHCVTPFTI